jgi:hypothetical protein
MQTQDPDDPLSYFQIAGKVPGSIDAHGNCLQMQVSMASPSLIGMIVGRVKAMGGQDTVHMVSGCLSISIFAAADRPQEKLFLSWHRPFVLLYEVGNLACHRTQIEIDLGSKSLSPMRNALRRNIPTDFGTYI